MKDTMNFEPINIQTNDRAVCSSIQSIFRFLKSRNLVIDLDGKLFKILPSYEYKIRFIKLISLIMVGFVAHIIKKFPYHPITVMGNTVYCHIVASSLSHNNIPYIMCKGTNRIPYYEINTGEEIPFEGPGLKYFIDQQSTQSASISDNNSTSLELKSNEKLIPLIPLSHDEINKLQTHTKLENLEQIQNTILETFPVKDGVHLSTMNYFINHESKLVVGPVINIRRFFGGLYYIMTNNEFWISRLVITDNVIPLQPGDVISSISGIITRESHDQYSIDKMNNTCTINDPTIKTILTRCYNYRVNSDLTINKETNSCQENTVECILYNLKQPRPFIHNSVYTIHPFHLPEAWDPFLTIMIVSRGLLASIGLLC